MIFLEYVATKLIGRPTARKQWVCPWCNEAQLKVRPPKRDYAIKFKCWNCDKWGDAMDLATKLRPDLNPDERKQLIAEFRKDFDATTSGSLPSGQSGAGSYPDLSPNEVWKRWWRDVGDHASTDAQVRKVTDAMELFENLAVVGLVPPEIGAHFRRQCQREAAFKMGLLEELGIADTFVETDHDTGE
ncbi:hypothetical protein [Crateriforma spongiae]|uniref:hypothetical protein n=1 Tax=Crateriforma spongiae TaxID=2724528 RepID=UPI001445532B|nr:hypothetical protein [Crateriforma spongiae]